MTTVVFCVMQEAKTHRTEGLKMMVELFQTLGRLWKL